MLKIKDLKGKFTKKDTTSNRLLIMRHSKAEMVAHTDFARELIPSGRKKAVDMAEKFIKKDIVPDLIIASDALRAAETAKIMADTLGVDEAAIHFDHNLYESYTAEEVAQKVIQKFDAIHKTVLLVGHYPTVYDLAWHLAGHSKSEGMEALKSSVMNVADVVYLKSVLDWSDWTAKAIDKVKFWTV